MQDSLFAKIVAGSLAGLVTLVIASGVSRLADPEKAAAVLARTATPSTWVAEAASEPAVRPL